jgi:hypothetical protein
MADMDNFFAKKDKTKKKRSKKKARAPTHHGLLCTDSVPMGGNRRGSSTARRSDGVARRLQAQQAEADAAEHAANPVATFQTAQGDFKVRDEGEGGR